MFTRATTRFVALSALYLSATLAHAGVNFVGGEQGFVDGPWQSSLSREAVQAELENFRANPAAADGSRHVGGEQGYVYTETASSTTRAEVLRELSEYRNNPVAQDGAIYVGGEASYVYPPQASSFAVAAHKG